MHSPFTILLPPRPRWVVSLLQIAPQDLDRFSYYEIHMRLKCFAQDTS